MFKATTIDFKSSGTLNQLVLDYISRNPGTNELYEHFPDEDGFNDLLAQKPYNGFDRLTLYNVLKEQLQRVNNNSAATIKNIGELRNENCFTVTTGHQLCLFTGPLYFIYKIFSVINLATELSSKFPGTKFIPVYWMAGEDHDFAEVNHFNAFGKKIEWQSDQTGPVGEFNTSGLKELVPTISEVLGISDNAAKLISLFERTYVNHDNMSDATRYLVNELFGEYGLVTVDGNDKQLKALFTSQFRKDIFENSMHASVSQTVNEMRANGYSAQVNPREINTFYLEKDLRVRIERSGDGFKLAGTGRSFSAQEMNEIIDHSPWKLSPNVVLRPLYQQTVLPNLAYVGGPGELAYWLEYRKMFKTEHTIFPILVPRAFITVVEKSQAAKIEKLKLTAEDFFKEEHEVIERFQVNTNNIFETEEEKEKLKDIFNILTERINKIDRTLVPSVAAELQKALNGLDNLTAKSNRSLKQRSETETNQIRTIRQKLFPGNIPQERFENFSSFFIRYGEAFFREVQKAAQPLNLKHIILTEE
jgi:bacillithiol synthase